MGTGKIGDAGHDDSSMRGPERAKEDAQDTGGGGGLPAGMDYQVFEVTDLLIPSGTDWSVEGHVLGTIPFDLFFSNINAYPQLIFYKFALETSAVLAGSDVLHLGLVRDVHDAANTSFDDASVDSTSLYQTRSNGGVFESLRTYSSSVPDVGENSFVLFTEGGGGATTADITVVKARAACLIL